MKKLMLCIVIMLVGCDPVQEKQSRQHRHAITLAEDLEYYKDDKTGICFAGLYVGANYGTLTQVPCRDVKEENLIHFISRDKR